MLASRGMLGYALSGSLLALAAPYTFHDPGLNTHNAAARSPRLSLVPRKIRAA